MTHTEKQIEHYAGIEDLPIHRWQDFNLALLVEAGAGDGVDGLESLISTAYRHLSNKEPEKAAVLLANCLQNIAFAREKITPFTVAWSATVSRIDGQDVAHLSAEQVAAKLDFKNQKVSYLKQFVEAFRKKCVGELEVFFPSLAKNPNEVEHAAYLKKRTQLLIKSILTGEELQGEVEKVDNYLLSMHRPQLLAGEKGVEVRMTKDFDSICLTMQTNNVAKPEMLSVRKFYAAVEMLTKKK